MYTKILTKDGKDVNILTQQYIVGTYVIINNDPSMQFGVTTKENQYHINVRKKALKLEDTIIGGTILEYKGKLLINTFKDETTR